MSVARVTEISAQSDSSFEDATTIGLNRAKSTLRNVRHAWVKEQEVYVDGDTHTYQVTMKVTFELDD